MFADSITSEKSDMVKSQTTFCCSITYKQCLTKVLRNLVI